MEVHLRDPRGTGACLGGPVILVASRKMGGGQEWDVANDHPPLKGDKSREALLPRDPQAEAFLGRC